MACYATLRLEEEIRIVLDVRRSLTSDDSLDPNEAASLMMETAKQLRDMVEALRVLERVARYRPGGGESTLSAHVRRELVMILGFTVNDRSKDRAV